MLNLRKFFSTLTTPQREPIPGRGQVANSAGGYVFPVDDWTRLDRFLVLGSEGGSYYASERALTIENAEAVMRCLDADGRRAVERVVEVSSAGRAPRNDPALFALAMAAGLGDVDTRRLALEALPRVARIGTHVFQFVEFVEGFRGWGRALKRAVGRWYQDKDPARLAYQAVKYRQRGGWSHRDLLRLAKPRPRDEAHQAVYAWIAKGETEAAVPRIIEGFERARQASDVAEVVRLIGEYRLPREAVPTEFLTEARVWGALLESMPLTAMIRNLGTMSRVGLLVPGSTAASTVVERLGSATQLRMARVHPMQVLMALRTYESGRGVRGRGEWQPVARVVDALDGAFYATFANVEPTGKRWVLALDVSGSMCVQLMGAPGLSARVAEAAMAMVTAAVEPEVTAVAFCDRMVPVTVSPRQRLDDVARALDRADFGGTDCALPMLWALRNGVEADVFAVYTDSETWAGKIHPVQALRTYREKTGIPARLVVIGMVSSGFSIADPQDGGMLDVVGFDTAAPAIMADFVRGQA